MNQRPRNANGTFAPLASPTTPDEATPDQRIMQGRKIEHNNQKAALEAKAETEFYGGLFSHGKWDKSRFHIGYEDTTTPKSHKIPHDPQAVWGFNANDVKEHLAKSVFLY